MAKATKLSLNYQGPLFGSERCSRLNPKLTASAFVCVFITRFRWSNVVICKNWSHKLNRRCNNFPSRFVSNYWHLFPIKTTSKSLMWPYKNEGTCCTNKTQHYPLVIVLNNYGLTFKTSTFKNMANTYRKDVNDDPNIVHVERALRCRSHNKQHWTRTNSDCLAWVTTR